MLVIENDSEYVSKKDTINESPKLNSSNKVADNLPWLILGKCICK